MYKERDLFVCRIIKEHEWYCRILSKSNNHDFFSLKFMFFFFLFWLLQFVEWFGSQNS
jgi:hypothetical protein